MAKLDVYAMPPLIRNLAAASWDWQTMLPGGGESLVKNVSRGNLDHS